LHAGLCFAACSYGQEATIRATVPLVILPTSVTDQKGHFIEGLGHPIFCFWMTGGLGRSVKIQRTGVTIYSLTYSAYLTPFTTRASEYSPPSGSIFTELTRLPKKNTVEALTTATGGRQMKFETKSKLENDLIRLGTEIHSRYLVSFTPDPAQTPSFHHLEVRIKDRPDAVVRARPGYWAGLR
jgi:hypothetical protein